MVVSSAPGGRCYYGAALSPQITAERRHVFYVSFDLSKLNPDQTSLQSLQLLDGTRASGNKGRHENGLLQHLREDYRLALRWSGRFRLSKVKSSKRPASRVDELILPFGRRTWRIRRP
jgi:hypothetical protein